AARIRSSAGAAPSSAGIPGRKHSRIWAVVGLDIISTWVTDSWGRRERHGRGRAIASIRYFAAGWSSVLLCKPRVIWEGVSAPPPEKVMVPLLRVRSRDSSTQPAARSKRIVPSEDSTSSLLLVTFSGDGLLGSGGGHLTSMTLLVILSMALSPRFSVPAYS